MINLQNSIQVRLTKTKKEFKEVLNIRKTVLIREQNVPQGLELDGLDKISLHVIVFCRNKPIGCARARIEKRVARLERIALLKSWRGKGVGNELMSYLIRYCSKKGAGKIIMHSQYYLKNFYAKFGFKPFGSPFTEAGIKHLEMRLRLRNEKE